MIKTYLAFTVYVAQKKNAEDNSNLGKSESRQRHGKQELTISNWGKIRLRHMLDNRHRSIKVDILERMIRQVFGIDELTVEGTEHD